MKFTSLKQLIFTAILLAGCVPMSPKPADSTAIPVVITSGSDIESSSKSPKAPLANTYWKLTALNNAPVTMAPSQPREAYVQFREDTQAVRGFAGCNKFSGAYEASENRLSLGPMATTRMACADASAAEAQFLSALEQTVSFAILGDVLILIDGKGVTTAEFTAVYF